MITAEAVYGYMQEPVTMVVPEPVKITVGAGARVVSIVGGGRVVVVVGGGR